MFSANTAPPLLGPRHAVYPQLTQWLRVTGPPDANNVYPALMQQSPGAVPKLRDREPVWVWEPNGIALGASWVRGRVVGSYTGLLGTLPLLATSFICCVGRGAFSSPSPGPSPSASPFSSSSSFPSSSVSSSSSVSASASPSSVSPSSASPSSVSASASPSLPAGVSESPSSLSSAFPSAVPSASLSSSPPSSSPSASASPSSSSSFLPSLPSESSSLPDTVSTDCCPGVPICQHLIATFTSSGIPPECAALNGATMNIDWNGTVWHGITANNDLTFQCNGGVGNFGIQGTVNGVQGAGGSPSSYSCSPFSVTFVFVNINGCLATVTVTPRQGMC